ncbi:MAG: hypothetical protein JOY53_10150, partial [Acidobacteriaceae bacterium]|nr:hypothetical protein [Acidobacteriaceae bacterium]
MRASKQAFTVLILLVLTGLLASCTRKDAPAQQKTAPSAPETVGVAVIKNQPLETTLTLSSELVPFQEI